jgi:hypothetical protein
MPAFLEKVAPGIFVLRTGPAAVAFGDPYTASGTIVTVADGVCEVKGFTHRGDDPTSSREMLRAARRCLQGAGFTHLRWERRREARYKNVMVRI